MPTKPNFHPFLELPDPRKRHGETPGPIAGGIIADGDELMWVYVWIIQNGDEMGGRPAFAAAADGESPDGKTFKGEWEVETHMTHDCDSFSTEIAALGTAMALVKRANNGGLDAYWWTDAVNLRGPDESTT